MVQHDLAIPAGISVHRAELRDGTPAVELLAYAARNDIELIAMGAPVRDDDERFHLGGVASGILHSAQCCVLIAADSRRFGPAR